MVQPSCFASSALHLPTMCLIKLQEGEEESEEEEAEPEEAPKPAPAPPPARAAPRSRGAKGRRQTPRDQEDIDEILRELPQAAGEERSIGEEAGPSDGRPLKQAQRPLLAVSARHLKASEELKRMFGSDAIEEDDEAGAAYAGRLWCLSGCLEQGGRCPRGNWMHSCLPASTTFVVWQETPTRSFQMCSGLRVQSPDPALGGQGNAADAAS